MQADKSKKLGKTSTGAILLLKANIHCFKPPEVENVALVTTNSKRVPLDFENSIDIFSRLSETREYIIVHCFIITFG